MATGGRLAYLCASPIARGWLHGCSPSPSLASKARNFLLSPLHQCLLPSRSPRRHLPNGPVLVHALRSSESSMLGRRSSLAPADSAKEKGCLALMQSVRGTSA